MQIVNYIFKNEYIPIIKCIYPNKTCCPFRHSPNLSNITAEWCRMGCIWKLSFLTIHSQIRDWTYGFWTQLLKIWNQMYSCSSSDKYVLYFGNDWVRVLVALGTSSCYTVNDRWYTSKREKCNISVNELFLKEESFVFFVVILAHTKTFKKKWPQNYCAHTLKANIL